MEISPIPLTFRAHLIPFLKCELSGIVVSTPGMETKLSKIDPGSSIGKFIISNLCNYGIYFQPTTQIYIRFDDISKNLESCVYAVFRRKDSIIYVPAECKREINDFIEDIFRVAMIYHVNAMQKVNRKLSIKECLEDFMIQYEMDDFGFEVESLRKVLTRNSDFKLKRMQNHSPHYPRT